MHYLSTRPVQFGLAESPNQLDARHMTPLDEDTAVTERERAALRELIGGTVESAAVADELSIDTIFDLLSHPGRRYVVTYLLRSEGFASMSELVDYVMEQSGHSMTEQQFRYRVAMELTHKHVPRLAEEGVLQYNVERQIILPTERTPLLEPYITIALAQRQILEEGEAG